MLVLNRKEGERIHLGDNVVLVINHIRGRQVSIAIEAPDDLVIKRGELYLAEQAAQSIVEGTTDAVSCN